MRRVTLRRRADRRAGVAYVPGLGRILLIWWGGEIHVWRYTGAIGEWANRKAFASACERAKALLA